MKKGKAYLFYVRIYYDNIDTGRIQTVILLYNIPTYSYYSRICNVYDNTVKYNNIIRYNTCAILLFMYYCSRRSRVQFVQWEHTHYRLILHTYYFTNPAVRKQCNIILILLYCVLLFFVFDSNSKPFLNIIL